jgi:hypothetical protein
MQFCGAQRICAFKILARDPESATYGNGTDTMMLRNVQKKRDSVCQYPWGKRKLRPGLCTPAEDTNP